MTATPKEHANAAIPREMRTATPDRNSEMNYAIGKAITAASSIHIGSDMRALLAADDLFECAGRNA